MVRKDMLKDPSWQKLSSTAKILWLYMRNNYDYSDGTKETFITYKQMENIIGSKAMSRGLKELQDPTNKWIEKTKVGGLFGGVCKYKFAGQYKEFYYKQKVV